MGYGMLFESLFPQHRTSLRVFTRDGVRFLSIRRHGPGPRAIDVTAIVSNNGETFKENQAMDADLVAPGCALSETGLTLRPVLDSAL